MGTCRKVVKQGCTWLPALVALALLTVAAVPNAAASSACGGSLSPAIVSTGPFFAGSTVVIRYTIGVTASGGTTNTETVSEFDFDLDCANGGSFLSCSPESNTPINWDGGTTVSATTCKNASNVQVTWSTAHTASASPNDVVLTPSSPVVLANNGTCTIDLTVLVNNPGNDSSPDFITQAAGFSGVCDTGLSGGGIGSDGFNVDVCSGLLDKQVSCDGGASWHDISLAQGGESVDDTNNASTIGCQAYTGDTVLVRYVLKNTGTIALSSCAIADTNGALTPPTVTTPLAAGATFDSDSVALHANDASEVCSGSVSEPDTASVTCSCAGTSAPVIPPDTATFSCVPCSVAIDKQVTCPTGTFDVTCTDPPTNSTPAGCDPVVAGQTTQTQSQNCIGLNAIANPPRAADPITVNYVITNTGSDTLNCNTGTVCVPAVGGGLPTQCGVYETNADISLSPTDFGGDSTFATSASTTVVHNLTCSATLSTDENAAGGDTASIDCLCAALTNNTITNREVTAHDSADFVCQGPGLSVTKSCSQQGATIAGDNDVSITATNNGNVNLINCAVVDTNGAGTGSPTGACSANGATLDTLTGGTNESSILSPAATGTPPAYQLAPKCTSPGVPTGCVTNGGQQTWTGEIAGLTSNTCNQAVVTCNVDDGTGSPVLSGGVPVTVVGQWQDTCEFAPPGCETRTPGYWAQHSSVTDEVIADAGGTLQSCGININDNGTGTCTAFEDLCSIGQDSNRLGIDPLQQNLIFQCMAAELNVEVSNLDGVSCDAALTGLGLDLGVCCGSGGVCATGATEGNFSVVECQNLVSEFNTLFDTTTEPNGILAGAAGQKALPADCQAAKGDGIVNTTPPCSGSRTYIVKKTGKK
ncbi:MAG TPA: hypothetical protein VG204_03185 [Terriglobia bacterium]|nr:hypothetical protein [Terriglobia bacterium]